MKILIILTLLSLLLVACTRTENGLVFGLPGYEKRDIQVTIMDLEILEKAKNLLINTENWSKDELRTCDSNPPYNLYCALEKASIIVDGKYIHRRPALQEVRFTIDDKYKNRWKVHRLADFNKHPITTHNDIINVLNEAIERVKRKLSSEKPDQRAIVAPIKPV